MTASCGCAGIGRLASLRCLCPDGRTGSTPVSRTTRRGRHIVRGDFFQKSPLTHFVAAPFQIATAALGCGGRSSQSLDDFSGHI